MLPGLGLGLASTLTLTLTVKQIALQMARSSRGLVSFAAVIRVVTRHATLLPTSGEERCVTSDE